MQQGCSSHVSSAGTMTRHTPTELHVVMMPLYRCIFKTSIAFEMWPQRLDRHPNLSATRVVVVPRAPLAQQVNVPNNCPRFGCPIPDTELVAVARSHTKATCVEQARR